MREFAALLQLGGSVLAVLVYFVGMAIVTSVPQEAVVAASALCAAVVPYVFGRGLLTAADARDRRRGDQHVADLPDAAPAKIADARDRRRGDQHIPLHGHPSAPAVHFLSADIPPVFLRGGEPGRTACGIEIDLSIDRATRTRRDVTCRRCQRALADRGR